MYSKSSFKPRHTAWGLGILIGALTCLMNNPPVLAYLPTDDDFLCDFPQELKFYNFNRWFSYELPLRVYITPLPRATPPLPYRSIIQQSFASWSAVMPQFHFQFVQTPAQAQIIVKWTENLPESEAIWGATLYPQAYFNSARKMLHKAEMHIALKESKHPDSQEGDELNTRPEIALSSAELQAEATHALGHALGLPHSKNREDLMSAYLFVRLAAKSQWSLTARDTSSLKKLYSLPPRLEGSPCNGGN